MTEPTDRTAYVLGGLVPGQLDLHGFTAEEAEDFGAAFEDRLNELAAQRERLNLAVLAHQQEALQGIAQHTREAATAGAQLDAAVHEARAVGATWQQIADAAGITRQSAHTRWSGR